MEMLSENGEWCQFDRNLDALDKLFDYFIHWALYYAILTGTEANWPFTNKDSLVEALSVLICLCLPQNWVFC